MKTRQLKTVTKKAMNNNLTKLRSKINVSKLVCTALLVVLHIAPAFAQTDDIQGQIKEWGDDIKLILNAVVAIFSVAGGFLIFIQYMQGNEQAQKNFIRFIIGLAIFGLIALIADVFLPDVGTDIG